MTEKELFDSKELYRLLVEWRDTDFYEDEKIDAVESFIQSECRRNRVEGARELIADLPQCAVIKRSPWWRMDRREPIVCSCKLHQALADLDREGKGEG